jgi:hypothetical protein
LFDQSLLFCFLNMSIIDCYIHFVWNIIPIDFYLCYQRLHTYFIIKFTNLHFQFDSYFAQKLLSQFNWFIHFNYQYFLCLITFFLGKTNFYLHFYFLFNLDLLIDNHFKIYYDFKKLLLRFSCSYNFDWKNLITCFKYSTQTFDQCLKIAIWQMGLTSMVFKF